MIPSNYDPDYLGPVIVLCEETTTATPVSCTVALDYTFITFSPISFAEVGVHSVSIVLQDVSSSETSNLIQVTVINTAPYFTKSSLPTLK
jgi:hypothetical protein